MSISLLSPGVQVTEIDLTTVVPTIESSAGGLAGMFRWGPVNQVQLISSVSQLQSTFQNPDTNTAPFWFTCSNFLAYTSALNVVRANGSGLYNATANATATPILVANNESYFHSYFDGNNQLYGPWFARYAGGLGNSLMVSMCGSANAYQSNTTALFNITANAQPGNNIVATNNSTISTYIQVGDLVQIGTTAATNGFVTVTGVSGNNITVSAGPVAAGAGGAGQSITRRWAYASQFNGPPGTSSYVAKQGGSNDQVHIVVVDANGVFNGSTTSNYILEKWPYLSKASDCKNNSNVLIYYPQVLFNQSNYIYWADFPVGATNWGDPSLNTSFVNINLPSTFQLSGGNDGTAYGYTSFADGGVGDPNDGNLEDSWDYFNNTDEVTLAFLLSGPASPTLLQYVISDVAEVRDDCVAFGSPRYQDVVNQHGNELNNIINSFIPAVDYSSTYAFVDSGWKYQQDPYNNVYRYIPLNGDIAGLCARTDATNAPWWSPAGYNRGIIKNITKLAWMPGSAPSDFNPVQTTRDVLYTNAINPVITVKGTGTLLYGDVTFTTEPTAFNRINVRRLFIVLEQSISAAAKYSLFEFNDVFTRNNFINMVTPFLTNVQAQRGITAFQVVCDTTNNTQAVISANQFVGAIYILPNYVIDFIGLFFVATNSQVQFSYTVS